jgi:hypothetical protein
VGATVGVVADVSRERMRRHRERDGVRVEERDARRRARQLARARRVAGRRRERQARSRRAQVINAQLARAREQGVRCSCPITAQISDLELRALGCGCTDPWWVCPVLDAIRRRLGVGGAA